MERSEKFQRAFEKFEKAFLKFKEIVKSQELFDFLNEDLIIEVNTKRFEYVFESMWHSLKEHLKHEGIDAPSPLRCFKEAFKLGMIDENKESIYMEIIKKRNEIVHIYDFNQAKKIYEFIRSDSVFSAVEDIYKKLKDL